MKFLALIVTIFILIFVTSCSSNNVDRSTTPIDELAADVAWFAGLNDEERERGCYILNNSGRKELQAVFMSEPDPMTKSESNAFINLMEKEC